LPGLAASIATGMAIDAAVGDKVQQIKEAAQDKINSYLQEYKGLTQEEAAAITGSIMFLSKSAYDTWKLKNSFQALSNTKTPIFKQEGFKEQVGTKLIPQKHKIKDKIKAEIKLKTQELSKDIKKNLIDKANKNKLPIGNHDKLDEIIHKHVKDSLNFRSNDFEDKGVVEISSDLYRKLDTEIWSKFLSQGPQKTYPASSANASEALKQKFKILESYQKDAVETRVLPDGRIRYYKLEGPAHSVGPTKGSKSVVEYNPRTGKLVQRTECYDQHDNINRVHIKNINGQTAVVDHFPKTKKEIDLLKNKK